MGALTYEKLLASLSYDSKTGLFSWRAIVGKRRFGSAVGSIKSDGYLRIKLSGQTYLAHRLAWLYIHGNWPKNHLDHINHVRSDNRIENLRDVDTHKNMQNQSAPHVNNSVGMLGVGTNRSGKPFRARITTDGVCKYLGSFQTKEDAEIAYKQAKTNLHISG